MTNSLKSIRRAYILAAGFYVYPSDTTAFTKQDNQHLYNELRASKAMQAFGKLGRSTKLVKKM